MAEQHRPVTAQHPYGYVPAWSLLTAGAFALVVFHFAHHPAAGAPSQAAPGPRVTVTAPQSPPASRAAVRSPAPGKQTERSAAGASVPGSDDVSGAGTSPSPAPSPTPSPTRLPAPGVVAALVVPLRGATPVAVRASVVAPSAPPFPQPILEVGIGLGLPGLVITASP